MRKRVSRNLWDKARKPSTSNNTAAATATASKAMSILKAIIYELQPIDLMHHHSDLRTNIFQGITNTVTKSIKILPPILTFLQRRSIKEWLSFLFIIGYWKIVVYFHKTLDAGPFIIILTALVIIFTIGLGDNNNDNHQAGSNGNNLSAYSVFNRGFRNIMGGVDATSLLQQHVGAGLMPPPGGNRGDADRQDDDRQDDGFRLRQQRQQERDRQRTLQQQRDRERLLQQHQHQHQHQQQQQQQHQHQHQQEDQNDDQHQQSEARKSNKKNRNRRKQNIELRREMQRQRDAAAEMGFNGDGLGQGHGQGQEGQGQGHVQIGMQHRDQIAMNRLVEDQMQHNHEFDE